MNIAYIFFLDYHFVSREAMEAEIADGKFIESAVFSSNMYGTSKRAVADVLQAGRICVLDIDMQVRNATSSTEV